MGVAGRLLVAAPPLGDPNFERAVVLMLQHDQDGAFGLVISDATDEVDAVDDDILRSWIAHASPPATLFIGGPVQHDAVLALARFSTSEEHSWTNPVALGLHTVDLDSDPANGVECDALRLFIGYSGWGPMQLDGEIAAEHWFVVDAIPGDAFDDSPTTLWRRVLERDPVHQQWVRRFPDDPDLN